MGQIVDEVKLWNTPLIGAYMLWKFTSGYSQAHPNGDAPIGILHFLANGILTSKKLRDPISNQRENLQSYIRSFEERKDADLLLSIQARVAEKRNFTMAAIDIAVLKGLLYWDLNEGKLYPKNVLNSPTRGNAIKSIFVQEGRKAEILGKWFAQHDLHAISNYLKVIL